MRILRSVLCVLRLVWLTLAFAVQPRKSGSLAEYLFAKARKAQPESATRACLAKWLLSGALADRDPKRLLALYKDVLTAIPGRKLRAETTVAVFESAVWLEDRTVAEQLLLTLAAASPPLPATSVDRLRQLFNWRFKKDMVRAEPLLSPLAPTDYFLPYLFFLARAVVADSMGKKADALGDYRRALTHMPPESREYSYALDRCNNLVNEV